MSNNFVNYRKLQAYIKFVLLGMLSIVIVGTGNVAQHLFKAFLKTTVGNVVQVFGRNESTREIFSKNADFTTEPTKIMDADVYLIAVADDSINEVSKLLDKKDGIVAHTSGSVVIDALNVKRRGVFYPLQTFTKGKSVDFSGIPICIEAKHAKDLNTLQLLASALSNSVYEISTNQRQKLHLAAVFANNFTNHLYHISSEICNEEELPFELLKPLIQETADKIRILPPESAQTGPARRNDVQTMQRHLEALKSPVHKKLYQLLSESIKQFYEEKL